LTSTAMTIRVNAYVYLICFNNGLLLCLGSDDPFVTLYREVLFKLKPGRGKQSSAVIDNHNQS